MIHYGIIKRKNEYLGEKKINELNMNIIHVSKKKLNSFIIREPKFYQNYFLYIIGVYLTIRQIISPVT